jgi:hypothetical protein
MKAPRSSHISKKEEAFNALEMEIFTKDNTLIILLMVSASISGQIKMNTRDSFLMEKDKEMDSGKALMVNFLKVNIIKIKETAMEFILGRMVMSMKDNLNTT